MLRRHLPALLGLAPLALARPARAAELVILCSNGLQTVLEAMTPAIEGATGDRLLVSYQSSNVLKGRIDDGAAFDVAILTPGLIAALAGAGRITPGSETTLARAGLGVAVRAGAPRPDISTPAAFRAALLAAPSIVYSATGQSGIGFLKALDTLGIADAVKPKARTNATGPNGAVVARGEAAMAVQLIPELLPVPGIELVGPFPAELQSHVVLTAGIGTAARDPARARAIIAALTGPDAAAVIRAKGMEPA